MVTYAEDVVVVDVACREGGGLREGGGYRERCSYNNDRSVGGEGFTSSTSVQVRFVYLEQLVPYFVTPFTYK